MQQLTQAIVSKWFSFTLSRSSRFRSSGLFSLSILMMTMTACVMPGSNPHETFELKGSDEDYPNSTFVQIEKELALYNDSIEVEIEVFPYAYYTNEGSSSGGVLYAERDFKPDLLDAVSSTWLFHAMSSEDDFERLKVVSIDDDTWKVRVDEFAPAYRIVVDHDLARYRQDEDDLVYHIVKLESGGKSYYYTDLLLRSEDEDNSDNESGTEDQAENNEDNDEDRPYHLYSSGMIGDETYAVYAHKNEQLQLQLQFEQQDMLLFKNGMDAEPYVFISSSSDQLNFELDDETIFVSSEPKLAEFLTLRGTEAYHGDSVMTELDFFRGNKLYQHTEGEQDAIYAIYFYDTHILSSAFLIGQGEESWSQFHAFDGLRFDDFDFEI